MNKPTQQQIIEAYKKLPPLAREFLADPDQLAQVLTEIRNTHDLHVDVIGQVNESIGYLLLGLTNPNEFKDTLKTVGVSEDTINNIIAEINQKIFVPLREQMRSGAGNTQPIKSAEPVKPVLPRNEPSFTNPTPANPRFSYPAVAPSMSMSPRTKEMNASTPKYAPPTPPPPPPPPPPSTSAQSSGETQKYFHLENKIAPTPTQQSAVSAPSSVVQNNGLADALKQVLHEEKQAPINPNEKLLEDHEEPHLNIGASEKVQGASSSSIPVPLKPSTLPLTPSSGVIPPGVRFSPIVPKIEPAAPTIPIPPELSEPIPPVTPPAVPVTPAPPAPSRPYSTDPYREPIDTQ